MNTSILALDLGSHTGWALHQLDNTITSGTEHFKPQRFEGGGMRFLRFRGWLAEIAAFRPEQGLEELAQARSKALEQGRLDSFDRVLAGRDPSGRVRRALLARVMGS